MNLLRLLETHKTGFPGSVNQEHIPSGWASLTWFPYYARDDSTDYVGPILRETDTMITLEIFGQPLSFRLDQVIVTHALEATA